ncbi:MAG: RidA family protein [Chloroflexi bacterium]|nr:RidA family protein [Chloroflexota bacterium]
MPKQPYFHGPRPSSDKFPNAVRSGNLVFTFGHVAVGEDGEVISPDDIVGQADAIFERLSQLIELAGSDMAHVLKITAFLTNADDYPAYNQARHRWFPINPPASSSVIVKALVRPELVLEIEAVAELAAL